MRGGWLALGAFVAIAFACGGPASSGGDGTPTDTPPPSGTGTSTGTPTSTPTGTGTAGPLPTLTNVPSYANWDANVRPTFPVACSNCHGSSGGFSLNPTDTDPTNKKYWWFSSLCNRNFMNDHSGTQSYSPISGRLKATACGEVSHSGGTISDMTFCNALKLWLPEGGTHTPPLCADQYNYDLANSQ